MKKTSNTLLTIWALAFTVMLIDSANAETRLFVPQFSSGPQQETQLLLVNSNKHDSQIDLWAFTPDGHLAGQSQVTVPGNSTRSLTLKEAFQLGEPLSGWLAALSNDDGIGLSYSLTGPLGTFIPVTSQPILSGGGFNVVTFANLPSAINGQPSVILRLTFTGGTSNGNNLETVIDNIQLTGVPEPTTVAGGLLGVLGLCWHQRRRLIWSVRFRRT